MTLTVLQFVSRGQCKSQKTCSYPCTDFVLCQGVLKFHYSKGLLAKRQVSGYDVIDQIKTNPRVPVKTNLSPKLYGLMHLCHAFCKTLPLLPTSVASNCVLTKSTVHKHHSDCSQQTDIVPVIVEELPSVCIDIPFLISVPDRMIITSVSLFGWGLTWISIQCKAHLKNSECTSMLFSCVQFEGLAKPFSY